ncbi:MAG: TonB-dependent receptor [Bacteroidales bacterium]|nr:TonB-dependent receptor [Bacteroidales bacterium]
MNKSTLFLIIFLVFSQSVVYTQNYTISGYLRDKNSGEELLYASVYVRGTSIGCTTNEYGFYSLSLPKGKYTLSYGYIGYGSQEQSVSLNNNITQNVELLLKTTDVGEVIISGERNDANVTGTEVSTIKLNIKESRLIPVLFGEQDVLKTMQLMPGVSPSSEGSSGFFVRGGDSDQNLILLDEATVYNASHLLGFFSVFNSDALKNLKMYKAGIPAQYGGRISSVTDIRMKNGNMKNFEVSGGIGLVSTRITVEGPVIKNKASVIISARRTYADLFVRTFKKDYKSLTLYFYDVNGKANLKIGEKDRIYLSGYFGRDAFGMDFAGFDWGNKTATLRWNHLYSNKLFSNTSLIYSDFNYGFNVGFSSFDVNLNAGVYDYSVKQDYKWYLSKNNTISFGVQSAFLRFKPMNFTVTMKNDTTEDAVNREIKTEIAEQKALESAIYVSNKQKIGWLFSIEYGIRASMFNNVGPYVIKEYNEENDIIDSTAYKKNEFYNTYFCLEPRINTTLMLNKISSLKASYNRTSQYLHLLSNSTSGSPTDMWMPSTPLIRPETADQFAVGYFKNFKNNMFEFSVEGFYKNLINQVDFEDGADAFGNPDVEAELVFGRGKAYGSEFLLRKNIGKLTGWASYTLLKSERQFDDIYNGNWFSARQDRTHDLSFVASYKITAKITASGTWIYYTGDAVTFPAGKMEIDGVIVNIYTERNGDRMPNYHRLDLGVTFVLKKTTNFYNDLNVSVYNVYNRKNAYSITFQENKETGNPEAERMALFGIVPSVSWNFRF